MNHETRSQQLQPGSGGGVVETPQEHKKRVGNDISTCGR